MGLLAGRRLNNELSARTVERKDALRAILVLRQGLRKWVKDLRGRREAERTELESVTSSHQQVDQVDAASSAAMVAGPTAETTLVPMDAVEKTKLDLEAEAKRAQEALQQLEREMEHADAELKQLEEKALKEEKMAADARAAKGKEVWLMCTRMLAPALRSHNPSSPF